MMREVAQAVEQDEQRGKAPGHELTAGRRRDPLLAPDASLLELVEAVRALPYGRPRERSMQGLLRERRGTCSTKHLLLARVLAERFPETRPQIVHRVYRVQRDRIRARHGESVAAVVPEDGLVDVHRYLLIQVEGRQLTLDATFPGCERWDGFSSLPVACGPGKDVLAGDDPDADKRALEARYCDPVVRESFIAALAAASAADR